MGLTISGIRGCGCSLVVKATVAEGVAHHTDVFRAFLMGLQRTYLVALWEYLWRCVGMIEKLYFHTIVLFPRVETLQRSLK